MDHLIRVLLDRRGKDVDLAELLRGGFARTEVWVAWPVCCSRMASFSPRVSDQMPHHRYYPADPVEECYSW